MGSSGTVPGRAGAPRGGDAPTRGAGDPARSALTPADYRQNEGASVDRRVPACVHPSAYLAAPVLVSAAAGALVAVRRCDTGIAPLPGRACMSMNIFGPTIRSRRRLIVCPRRCFSSPCGARGHQESEITAVSVRGNQRRCSTKRSLTPNSRRSRLRLFGIFAGTNDFSLSIDNMARPAGRSIVASVG